jgi:glycosyltransferase involved in cell wall biosynthesis
MITFVTPMYKSDRYLRNFRSVVVSCVKQLERLNVKCEVIFVPKDPTKVERDFLNSLKQYPWFREIDSPNPSLYGAWNSGALSARGEVIGFWPVDDYRYAEGVNEAVGLFKQGADLVYSPFRVRRYLNFFGHDFLVYIQTVKKQLPEFNEKTYPEFLRSMMCTPFFIMKKQFYLKVGPFDEQFKIAGDFDWCIRAAKTSNNFKRGKIWSGSFRVDGRGASAGGTPRHTAENNIVYFRHRVQEKITKGFEELMKEYDSKTVMFRGNKYELSDKGIITEKSLIDFNSQVKNS